MTHQFGNRLGNRLSTQESRQTDLAERSPVGYDPPPGVVTPHLGS